MASVERRDKQPAPTPEPQKEPGGSISRREFLGMTGTGIAGLVIGGLVGREVFPKQAAPAAAPAAEPAAAPAEGAEAAPQYLAGFTLKFNPMACTGCMKCAVACSEKYRRLFPS